MTIETDFLPAVGECISDRGAFTAEQIEVLLRPIKPERVFHLNGQSHVAAYDVTAHLNRLFGFDGWDKQIVSLDLVREHSEERKGRDGWWVTYRCVMRLTVRDPDGRVAKVVEEAATGSAENQPSYGDAHDLAVKNSVSYALKRCAKDLGDQFGLSLYAKGSTGALVGRTLVDRKDGPPEPAGDVDGHVEVDGEGHDPTVNPVDSHTPEAAQAVQDPVPEAHDAPDTSTTPAPSNAAHTATQGDTDGHPLDRLVDRLAGQAGSTTRARSMLLRQAVPIARDQGLTVSIGWEDLRDGPIRDALLAAHAEVLT